jgi:ubiquitin fusion degradation protein 1
MFGMMGTEFSDMYRCHSVSLIAAQQQRDPARLESSDKIILPPSALEKLAHLEISYPMMFELTNPHYQEMRLHCGVLEFIAQEGIIYLPHWIMENLHLGEGDMLHVRSATIPKGIYVKLQPQTSDFVKISNPKAVLEATLRNFSALTKGEVIRIFYNNKQYDIGVVEVKPEGGRFAPRRPEAVCIIEADVQVDFAPPADYIEPKREPAAPAARPVLPSAPPLAEPNLDHDSSDDERKAAPKFVGSGMRLDGKSSSAKQRKSLGGSPAQPAAAGSSPVPATSELPRKPAFVGSSGTLSGKPVSEGPQLLADPTAQALGKTNAFGPALARSAELRRAAEEREKRAAVALGLAAVPPAGGGPSASEPAAATAAAAAAPASAEPVDYWASMGSGNRLQ